MGGHAGKGTPERKRVNSINAKKRWALAKREGRPTWAKHKKRFRVRLLKPRQPKVKITVPAIGFK
jgi:hypothetical protein